MALAWARALRRWEVAWEASERRRVLSLPDKKASEQVALGWLLEVGAALTCSPGWGGFWLGKEREKASVSVRMSLGFSL